MNSSTGHVRPAPLRRGPAAVFAVVLVTLLAAGTVSRQTLPLLTTRAADVRGVAGVLGGWRTLAADLVWLRAYATWEKRDAPATESLIELATAIDPQPLYFWLNGARMMAYDMPVWRIVAAGGFDAVSATEQERIGREQAWRALRFLAKARRSHPAAAALWIEQANIELNRLHEVAAAAESYRRAAEQPNAPYFAARIHAELLRRLGRKEEALAFLTHLLPTLPARDDAAAVEVVRARIAALRRELGVVGPPR